MLISRNEPHYALTPTGVDCGFMLPCMADGVLSATRFAHLVSYPRGELVQMPTQLRVGLYGFIEGSIGSIEMHTATSSKV